VSYDDTAGIVLAAGAGRRFGGPKALVRFGNHTLLENAVSVLAESGCRRPVYVVLGCPLVAELPTIDEMQVSWNPDWREGIGSSLRYALSLLATEYAIRAAVVVPVDQPGMKPSAVERLIQAHRGGAVVAVATYGGHRAHPVLLDRSTWAGVGALASGDAGARTFMQARPELVTEVMCDDVGIPDDIDTSADLVRLERALGNCRTCT
jgi:CTP:molybdopterin cytidylyltransferase MocA